MVDCDRRWKARHRRSQVLFPNPAARFAQIWIPRVYRTSRRSHWRKCARLPCQPARLTARSPAGRVTRFAPYPRNIPLAGLFQAMEHARTDMVVLVITTTLVGMLMTYLAFGMTL